MRHLYSLRCQSRGVLSETLDPRLAFSEVTSTGTLVVEGSSDNDSIDVRFGQSVVIVDVNGSTEMFQRSLVRRLAIAAQAGNDFVINRTNLRSTLDGGMGDDTLIGGRSDDTIVGGVGVNAMDGGIGLLTVDQSKSGPGGFGFSPDFEGDATRVVFASSRESVTRRDIVALRGGIRLLASDGDDAIVGSGGAAVTIDGGAGNDTFSGFEEREFGTDEQATFTGMPTFAGGDGNDLFDFEIERELPARIVGGAGNDTVSDSLGISEEYGTIDLGPGRDMQIVGDDRFGPSTVFMGPGVEKLFTDAAAFEVFGNSLSNTIEVSTGSNSDGRPLVRIYGGQGDDVITDTGNGIMYADGGAGNDLIVAADSPIDAFGFNGNDTLRGGAGNDTLIGGAGKDKLFGDAGDDLLLGRGGSKDRLDGGAGTDAATADVGPSVIDLVLNVETVN